MSALDSFHAALRDAGLDYAGPLVADGKFHRFKAAGDKARNSWFVIFPGTPAAGAFGCWKRGFTEKWCERRGRLTPAERAEVSRRWQEAERVRERTEKERHAQARKTAEWMLGRSTPASTGHPYLAAKGVQPHGELRQRSGALVLPLHDASETLHSLQFIGVDGQKRFLTAGRVAGCFFSVASAPESTLVICEGYATGASIHEATGFATFCAMNCGNLKAVAEALRAKWPEREIIIAADNDAFTKDKAGQPFNPGVEAATAAAQAIRARLAVPQFANVETKPTDFNDLHQLQTLNTVSTQIEAAFQPPKESEEEALSRLAALPPMEFDRRVGEAAAALCVRVPTLRSEVAKRRKPEAGGVALQGSAVNLAEAESWPEPVSGGGVLAEIAESFSRYVALPLGAADALALWTAHTHCFEAFQCSPRLNVNSPEKGCGKTTLRDVLASLVPRPLPTENLSVAVLFRIVERSKPTLLADECDAWLRDNEELRGMLNAGHRRGGQALRCEGEGNEVRAFNVFGPAVLCGIGALPGTLHDRSIVIRLERAKPGELRQRFDSRRTAREQELCRKLARWCADNRAALESCDPALPSNAFNRLADNWRPLFAVAAAAGGDWPQRAAAAFAKLTSEADADSQGTGAMLLADIQRVFAEAQAGRMFSKSIVDALCAMTDRPWPEAHRGKAITETWLARRLRDFGIASRTLRIADDRAKGYEAVDFTEAFQRYLSAGEESKPDSVTTQAGVDQTGFPSCDTATACHASETHETLATIGLSRCHASESPTRESELVNADLL